MILQLTAETQSTLASVPKYPFYIKTFVGGHSQVSTGTITGTQGTTN